MSEQIDVFVNENDKKSVTLQYEVGARGSGHFQWTPSEGSLYQIRNAVYICGYVARMTGTDDDGRKVHNNSTKVIPEDVKSKLGTPNQKKDGKNFKVTMTRPQDLSIQQYF